MIKWIIGAGAVLLVTASLGLVLLIALMSPKQERQTFASEAEALDWLTEDVTENECRELERRTEMRQSYQAQSVKDQQLVKVCAFKIIKATDPELWQKTMETLGSQPYRRNN